MTTKNKKLKTSDVVRKLVRDVNAQALTIRAILNLTNLSDEQIQKESVRILTEYTKVQALPPDLLEGEDDDDFENYEDDNFPVDVDEDGYPIQDDDYQDDYEDDSDDDYEEDSDSYEDESDGVDYEEDAVNLKNKTNGRISMHGGVSHHPAGAFVFGG
jgi:hypothetical protein